MAVLIYSIVALVLGLVSAPSQDRGNGIVDPRAIAVRWVIDNEVRSLAQAGLPLPSERLAFCVGTTVGAVQAGSAPTSAEAFWASIRDVKNPSSEFIHRIKDARFDLFGAEGCRQNPLGAPIDTATGRVTRGNISVGPMYQLESRDVEVLVNIGRNLSSATGWVLRFAPVADGWKLIDVRLVWQA